MRSNEAKGASANKELEEGVDFGEFLDRHTQVDT